jgi:hypothetical protein
MRLCASVLAIAVLVPLRAFAQAPAAPPETGAAGAPAMPPPPPPPPPAPPAAAPAPAAAAPAAPAAPAKTWKDLITIEGLVDAYYMYNFSGSTSQTTPQGQVVGTRSFDLNSNAFTLNYTKVGIGVAPAPVGLRMDLGYGATGAIINSGSPAAAAAMAPLSTAANALSAFIVEQAYVTAAFGQLTFDFGKFVTTAGSEVIESNKNWNYSRSLLFFYIPLVHTGARGTYKVNDQLTLQASVVNGWNDLGFEGYPTAGKTLGVSINYTASAATNAILTGYFGPEPLGGGMTSWRNLVDLVVAQTVGTLALNLNFDYINQSNNPTYHNYFGIAVMGRYPINEHLAIALRGEYAHPSIANAMAGTDAINLFEGTLTLAVPVGTNMEFRAEFRGDGASGPTGFDNFNVPPNKTSAITGTGAFMAWF